jgi:hypothetical protein
MQLDCQRISSLHLDQAWHALLQSATAGIVPTQIFNPQLGWRLTFLLAFAMFIGNAMKVRFGRCACEQDVQLAGLAARSTGLLTAGSGVCTAASRAQE